MRVIVDIATAQVGNAVLGLSLFGFVTDANFPKPRPDDKDPARCSLVGEVPLRHLNHLQAILGVITWHVVGMEP